MNPGESLAVAELDLNRRDSHGGRRDSAHLRDQNLALHSSAVNVRLEPPGALQHGLPDLPGGVESGVVRPHPALCQPPGQRVLHSQLDASPVSQELY